MSFGFTLCGNPKAVLAKAADAFDKAAEQCKNVPVEAESILLAKQVVLKQIEFYTTLTILPRGISVSCSGHGYFSDSEKGRQGDSTFKLEVIPLYGFVE